MVYIEKNVSHQHIDDLVLRLRIFVLRSKQVDMVGK